MSAVAATSYRRTVKYDMEALDLMIYKAPSLMIDRVQRGQLKSTLDLLLRLKQDNGSYTETYKHSMNSCGGFGRYYPQGCGMAYLHRPVRGALARNYYHDLDMINSLPNIVIQFAANRYGCDLKVMRDYVARRPHYYEMLVRDLGLKPKANADGTTESVEDQAKRIVNAVANGSGLERAIGAGKLPTVAPPAIKFLRELKTEMTDFATKTVATDAEFAALWAWTNEHKKSPASFCSKVVQREEARVLVAIDAFLTKQGRTTASWIYDGIFVERLDGEATLPADLIAACVAHIKTECGYDIGLKVKAFETYPKLDEWFAEWRTMEATEKMRSSVLVNGSNTILPEFKMSYRYVGECLAAAGDALAAYNTLIIRSHLGTGKTTEAVKMMKADNPDGTLKYQRILVISARKSFTRFIVGDLEKEGLLFTAYDDKNVSGNAFMPLAHIPKVVVQVESLWKLETDYEDYDFVVIDESETVLNQFYSLNTHKDNIRANHMMFERVTRNAKFVLYADAFVDQRTLLNATHLREAGKICYINNSFCPYERKATELYAIKESEDDESEPKEVGVFHEFCAAIMKDLKDKKRLVVVWTSLRKAEAFANTFLKGADCPYKWRLYSSKSNAEQNRELSNVSESWKDLNLLMMTTSITVGINYNPDDDSKIYDKIYLYACAKSALPRDIAQCLMRCRRIRSNELVYTVDRLVTSWMPAGAAEIRAAFLHRRASNRSANPVVNWTDSPKWVEDNYVMNERECAMKSYAYIATLESYLRASGYALEREEVEVKKHSPISSDKFDPTTVPIIDYSEAEIIRKAVNAGLADEMERLSLRRYNIYRNLSRECREAEDGEIAEEIWCKCYSNMDTERIFWNLVGEKHTRTERFAECEASGKYTEMVSKKVAKRIVLDKVMAALGMESSAAGKTEFVITPAIINAIAPLEADIYRAFSERGKSRRKGALTGSHIVDMLNMIFCDWTGAECAVLESKAKRVPKAERTEGSPQQITVFTVQIAAQPLWDYISEPRKEAAVEAPAAENTIELVM